MISRRDTLALAASAAGIVLAGPAGAQNVLPADLVPPGPLGDAWLGPADAKVTIIEYASLTCSHCATFHGSTWKELKTRYVDPGLVRFTLREFPLDPVATLGFMVARTDESARYYPITDLLFETQRSWAFSDKPLDAMRAVVRQAGITQEKFDAVLRDRKLYDAVLAVKNKAADTFKVSSTPTFFINGQRVAGAMSIDEIEKTIKPILGA